MPVFPFYKFSPSGNTTLFLLGDIDDESGVLCRLALGPEGICAEQCGMAELGSHRLQMGAGEFCANACRAFGALLALHEEPLSQRDTLHYDMKISGSSDPVSLTVRGQSPLWRVTALFSLNGIAIEKTGTRSLLVRLPGITHLLCSDKWPEFSEISELAKQCRLAAGLSSFPASGVTWWRERDGVLEILPHVEVPSSGTSMLESSCGSASLALALALEMAEGKKNFLVRQPRGDVLSLDLEPGNKAALTGDVRLCASGDIFLSAT